MQMLKQKYFLKSPSRIFVNLSVFAFKSALQPLSTLPLRILLIKIKTRASKYFTILDAFCFTLHALCHRLCPLDRQFSKDISETGIEMFTSFEIQRTFSIDSVIEFAQALNLRALKV